MKPLIVLILYVSLMVFVIKKTNVRLWQYNVIYFIATTLMVYLICNLL